MPDISNSVPTDLPSTRALTRSTVIALAVSGLVLGTVVLPAEYGVEPTGVGGALGLTRMGEIQAMQKEIVRTAADHLSPGGVLVWVTCSPTRAENEMVMAQLLAWRPELRQLDPAEQLPEGARRFTQVDRMIARTRPDLASVDGFAMAIVRREN